MEMTLTSPTHGLPDPERDAEFYEGVPMRRLIAWIIDAVVIIALSVAAVLVAGVLTFGVAFFFAGFLFMATSFIYRVVMLANKSATLGMMMMGIEFRAINGQRFAFREALIHTGLYTLIIMSFFGQLISMMTMATTEYGRSLPDFVLGSTAINKPL